MITQLIIVIVVLLALYLLLRQWPESEAPQTKWEANRQPVRLPQAGSWNKKIAPQARAIWQRFTALFKDDREKKQSHRPLIAHHPTSGAPADDEFAEFIGFGQGASSARVNRPPVRKPSTPPPVSPSSAPGWRGWRPGTKTPVKTPPPVVAPPSEAETLITKADAAKRNNNFTEAEKLLVRAASKEPKNPRVYAKIGLLYLEQGENWAEAEESFRQALKYDPHNGFIHNNLGLVLYNLDRYTAAAKEFEAACRIDDGIASRHANLGLCYLSLRQFSKAEQEFKRAARLDAPNEEYQDLLREAAEKRRRHTK